jgi:transcriptional regulator with XRE-family HTH domain
VPGPKSSRKPPRGKKNPIHRKGYDAVPAVLTQLREEAGFTLQKLADRLGWPLATVQKSENRGRRVDVVEFLDWCEACGVDVATGAKMLKRQ